MNDNSNNTNGIKNCKEKQKLYQILYRFKKLSPEYKDRFVRDIYGFLDARLSDIELEIKQESCKHAFSIWIKSIIDTSSSCYENGNYYFISGSRECWNRECVLCGYKERVFKNPMEKQLK